MRSATDSLAEQISGTRELPSASIGISAFVLFVVLVVFVQLYFAREEIARLSRKLDCFRASLEKASLETQTLVASVPGVKKKKARRHTNEIRVEIAAKERDMSGRTMVGAPPNLN